ncbi:MAG: PepSY domain-containing protein, partial [Candidatus Bathyarchaeia archaeon]
TAEKAKSIVEESLKKGWKAGEPRLMRTIYSVPLLDSNGATIGYVRVDGKSGEIIRRPTTMLAITSDQAKAIVSDAVMEFVIGGAKERGSLWMVSIKYKDKVVMVLLLGKLNTPTSEDAIKAVQESLRKGWSTGEPRQLRFIYNVPIIDANNNTIGTIKVDGRTGEIIIGIPMPLL